MHPAQPAGCMWDLRTALYAYLIIANMRADFLLRGEDTDQERYVEGAVESFTRR